MEKEARSIPEKLKKLGRVAVTAAVIGSAGYGTYKGAEYLAELEERSIDARCGGPERDECVEVKKDTCRFFPGGFGGGDLVCGYVIELERKTPIPSLSTPFVEK